MCLMSTPEYVHQHLNYNIQYVFYNADGLVGNNLERLLILLLGFVCYLLFLDYNTFKQLDLSVWTTNYPSA